jgi:hypothetical protein
MLTPKEEVDDTTYDHYIIIVASRSFGQNPKPTSPPLNQSKSLGPSPFCSACHRSAVEHPEPPQYTIAHSGAAGNDGGCRVVVSCSVKKKGQQNLMI